jgi:CheY-like chemotaxis protein
MLVVDDDRATAEEVVEAANLLGYQCSFALDAASALRAIAEDESIGIVVTDVQMPGMTGVEATQAIRARERTTGAHLPIIALTAHALQEERDEILHEGFDGYIAKPMEIGMLLQELRRCVAASSPHEA